MKKVITTLLFLMGIVGTTSATDYDLYVAGTRVTSSNAKNIMAGVSYDATNKVLTLNNATITSSSERTAGIWNSGIDGLTIKVIGNCYVTTANAHAMAMACSTTILGEDFPTLSVKSSDNDKAGWCGIWMMNGKTLTIQNIWLYVTAYDYGLYGANNSNSSENAKLELKRCTVSAQLTNSNASRSAVSNWKSIDTWGVSIDWNGNKFDSNKNTITDGSGKNVTNLWMVGRLTIGRYIINPYYDITLTKSNASAGISSGTIKWYSSTKELQLDGVSLTVINGAYPIAFYGYSGSSEPINIWVSGTNLIQVSKDLYAIWSYKNDLKIDGQSYTSSSLQITNSSSAYAAINCGGAKLDIGTVYLNITSGTNCLRGNGSTELTIGTTSGSNPGSKLSLLATSPSAISGFKSCTMNNSSTSNGTYFNTSKKAFTNIGGSLAQKVTIEQVSTNYDCYIFGNRLNNVNCNNFACEGVESGTIKWDNSTKTLTMTDVLLDNKNVTSQAAIRPSSTAGSSVTVSISGDNVIRGGHSSFYPTSDLTIKGKGNLTCDNTGEWGAILQGGNGTITIDVDGKVYFKGKYGYNTNGGSNSTNKLVLKNNNKSDYTFEGSTAAIDKLYGGLTLTELDFYSDVSYGGAPGCYFDTEDHRAEQNGGATAKKVNFIKPSKKYNINVGGTRVTNCNASGIGSKYISSGTTSVTYNSSSDKLILNNAKISIPENTKTHAIYTYSDTYCTVELIGKNELSNNNSNYTDIYFVNGGTITGGELVTKGTSRSDLYAVEGEMTIENSKITCAHSIWGEKKTATLTIDNSTVEANYYIGGFGNLYTANTYLIEPKNGKYDSSASTPYVVDAKGTRAAHVLYGPQELLGIENMEADTADGNAEMKHIYDTNGSEQGELKRGVNIIRMSDGTVRKVIKK